MLASTRDGMIEFFRICEKSEEKILNYIVKTFRLW